MAIIYSDPGDGAIWSATATAALKTDLDHLEADKQNTITGAATSIVSSDLTASRALASDGSGKVAVSAVTATELGYVAGVTSAIQTQLNAKVTATTLIPSETHTGSTSSSITLAQSPDETFFPFMLFKNGQKLIVGTDFSRTGTGVTLSYSRASSDVFEAVYHY